ncbi:hypothetical protein ETB97_007727 [Aspergillus alliaceus]|uniref:Major facilitator superfamily (MFS) profile domain-containing protein n=1 Tax=Petromyces alliaceus TaxID=209559 RepID=A0A8H6EB39_PETAA|nr:hypothetical protein ETB97_007727 [Aspergillus burnettii]
MPLLDTHTGPSYGTLDQMERRDQHEGEHLLPAGYESDGHDSEIASDDSVQEGVRKIEAISLTWTTKSLVVAYVSKHSLISTVLVVQNVVNAVIKPPMAKIADVFGRFEAFCVCILIYVLGYIQMAASTNVQTYASAQIFYSAGSTGLQILQQVFIADSSSLLNRAFLALLPEFPFLVTVWIGPAIADAVIHYSSWRWGYGMWSIILPASFLPLALTLLLNQRKAKRLNLIKRKHASRGGLVGVIRRTWYDLDMFGLILLSAAVTLILVPLTLAANARDGWKNNAGRVTQTFAFTSTIAAFSVSLLIKYTGRYRIYVTIGSAIYMFGLLLMMLYRKEGSSATLILGTQIVVGMGGGLLNVPVQLGVQASASHQDVAAATAMFLTAMEMGGAVGAAISGAVWTHNIPRKLRHYLPGENKGDVDEIFGRLDKALSFPMGSPARIAINRSYQETMNKLLVLALVATIPLIPLSLLMKNYRLDKLNPGPIDGPSGVRLVPDNGQGLPEGESESEGHSKQP